MNFTLALYTFAKKHFTSNRMAEFIGAIGKVYHRKGDREHELEMKREEDGYRMSVKRIDNDHELNKVKAGHDHEYKCLKEKHKHDEEMFDKKADFVLTVHKRQIDTYKQMGCTPDKIMEMTASRLPSITFD